MHTAAKNKTTIGSQVPALVQWNHLCSSGEQAPVAAPRHRHPTPKASAQLYYTSHILKPESSRVSVPCLQTATV